MGPMKEGQHLDGLQRDGELFTFRYPRWADVSAYVQMCQILHREKVMAYHMDTDFARGAERLSRFLLELEKGKLSHVLIEAESQIVGEGCILTGTAPRTGTLGIKIIGAYRRRGLGARMMALLEGEAKKLALGRIYLHVWGLNQGAIALYTQCGYRQVGRVEDWYSMDDGQGGQILSDRVEMIKDLAV